MKLRRGVSLMTNESGATKFNVLGSPPPAANSGPAKTVDTPGVVAFKSKVAGSETDKQTFTHKDDLVKEVAEARDTLASETQAYEKASFEGESDEKLPAGIALSDIAAQAAYVDVLAGVIARQDPRKHNTTRLNIFRNMYEYDAVCGTVVDLLSIVPFSEFSLGGIKDERILKNYVESIESMNMLSLLPQISIEYNMSGGVVLSTKWDKSAKKYKGIAGHDLGSCTFTQVPVFGIDPIIDITLSPTMAEGLRNEKIKELYSKYIPDDLLKMSQSGGLSTTLNPEDTIFIPRRGAMRDYSGTSLLQRALPAWLYEKALIRGTIDQVYKRQRGILHITVEGTEETGVPDNNVLNAITNLFLASDMDPLGAVVTTIGGVSTNEVKRGDEMWRWDENFDTIEKIKLRSLGVSDTFASADASYNTLEQALSVFVEGVRDFRRRITREIFYEKLFPRISIENNYTRKRYGNSVVEVAGGDDLMSSGGTFAGYDRHGRLVNNIGSDMPIVGEYAAFDPRANPMDYIIPQVVWRKRLMPEADGEYLGILDVLEQHGVKVGLRHWITSAGMNPQALIDGFEEDLKVREKFLEHAEAIAELEKQFNVSQQPPMGEGGPGGEEGVEEFARYLALKQQGAVGSVLPRSILSRGQPDHPSAEVADYDSQGHRRVMTRKGRQFKLNKYNKSIAEACVAVAERENRRIKREADMVEPTKKIYT